MVLVGEYHHLGPLILICVIYQALGIGIAWLTKQVFWVPHRFRYGILVAGGWANYGDIRMCPFHAVRYFACLSSVQPLLLLRALRVPRLSMGRLTRICPLLISLHSFCST